MSNWRGYDVSASPKQQSLERTLTSNDALHSNTCSGWLFLLKNKTDILETNKNLSKQPLPVLVGRCLHVSDTGGFPGQRTLNNMCGRTRIRRLPRVHESTHESINRSTTQYGRVRPSTAEYGRVRPSTAEYCRVQPSTAQ